jgi:general secretion pathway protein G
MRKTVSGFTIVELLVVIVVIAILAAITVVAYNGIQARARDNIRYADAKAIMKALELYRIDKGVYPPHAGTVTATCGTHNNGYDFSDATDNTWLKPLVDGGYLTKVPVPPNSGCFSYYSYLHPAANNYNCPSRTTSYYVLQVYTSDATTQPADSQTFTPCSGSTVTWYSSNTVWVFERDDV